MSGEKSLNNKQVKGKSGIKAHAARAAICGVEPGVKRSCEFGHELSRAKGGSPLLQVKQRNFLHDEPQIAGAGLPGDCDTGDLPQHLMRESQKPSFRKALFPKCGNASYSSLAGAGKALAVKFEVDILFKAMSISAALHQEMERLIEKMVPHLSAEIRPAKGDSGASVMKFSAETKSCSNKRWLQWPLGSAFLSSISHRLIFTPQHHLHPSVSFASSSLQFWEEQSLLTADSTVKIGRVLVTQAVAALDYKQARLVQIQVAGSTLRSRDITVLIKKKDVTMAFVSSGVAILHRGNSYGGR
ncbi:hypothetical protein EK904_014743 [Melospiza melodia maxima]|nr:hypothetical protein EK904_014743 [Melospiza melodia maxima]